MIWQTNVFEDWLRLGPVLVTVGGMECDHCVALGFRFQKCTLFHLGTIFDCIHAQMILDVNPVYFELQLKMHLHAVLNACGPFAPITKGRILRCLPMFGLDLLKPGACQRPGVSCRICLIF